MKKKYSFCLLAFVLTNCVGWSQTLFSQFSIGELNSWTLELDSTTNPDVFDLTGSRSFLGGAIILNDFVVDVDPSLSYSVAVQNVNLTSTSYILTYTAPISLFSGPTQVRASLGITLTDGGLDGAILTANGGSFAQTAFLDAIQLNTDLGGFPLSAGAEDTQVFSFNTGGWLPGPNGPGSILKIVTRFTLSSGDSAGVSGRVDIVTVPEPTAGLLLLLSGLVSGWVWRRKGHNEINN
jgi:hypothetical protein